MKKSLHSTTTALFENQEIRRVWHNDERYFVVSDIIYFLTNSKDVVSYIKKIRSRDESLAQGWGQIVTPLKIETKWWLQNINCSNTRWILRIIQSIPSSKAEPLKQWLATMWHERVEELNDPELWMQRARVRAIQAYKLKWWKDVDIKQRLDSIDVRHDYTDELKARWIDWSWYWIITNTSYLRSWYSAGEYKEAKWLLKHDNLRDHMTRTESLLTSLSEETAKQIMKEKDLQWFVEVEQAARKWAEVAKNTKEQIESVTWVPVISDSNRLTEKQKQLRSDTKNKLGHHKKK